MRGVKSLVNQPDEKLIWLAKEAKVKDAPFEVRMEARRILEARGYCFVGDRVEKNGENHRLSMIRRLVRKKGKAKAADRMTP